MQSIATFLLTNLVNRSDTAQRQVLSNFHYNEKDALTREDLYEFVESVLTQVLTLKFRRSVDLAVVTATLSWALHVDALGWNALVDKPTHHENLSFIERKKSGVKLDVSSEKSHTKKYIYEKSRDQIYDVTYRPRLLRDILKVPTDTMSWNMYIVCIKK